MIQNVKFLCYEKHSGESISYPFAFGIEGLSNVEISRFETFREMGSRRGQAMANEKHDKKNVLSEVGKLFEQ